MSVNYRILACGSNGNYQLGIGNNEDKNELVASKFLLQDGQVTETIPSKPIRISCGGNHTLVLLENGGVYSSGENTYGQCGLPACDNIPIFRTISGSNWINVSCGWEFSVLINSDGDVYVCGLGNKGELGLGKSIRRAELTQLPFSVPKKENSNKFCNQDLVLKSSLNHTVIKLPNNEFVGWGNCRKGQLGSTASTSNGKPESVFWEPRVLDFGKNTDDIVDFDVGREFTVLAKNNEVKVFGKLSSEVSVKEGVHLVDIKSMWSSVHLLVRDIKTDLLSIQSFGNNSHGQLYPVYESHPQVLHFTTGSEHGLLVSAENEVLAWGWGEHGNCGIQQKIQSDGENVTFDYLNQVFSGKPKISSVFGGCATSWVVMEEET
ncbi:regulator of chromosome condensation 1/beta-lactamase-inhibitor protein II [Scheffersomyces xylosifermentans]|uniref:regulator of chromosome condensation 1/beta-lactamase-inhibitor protein II n=1 Tax=Scheffersomyces xylosifermentans TaxID=1304137 RepID=UPI00315DC9CC